MSWADVASLATWGNFTTFILPPILGSAGGIGTVWLTWDVEKRRERLQYRKELVKTWRAVLLPSIADSSNVIKVDSSGPKYPFMRSAAYGSLRTHLSAEMRRRLEGQEVQITLGGDFPRREIMEEISRIERKWGLV